MSFCESLKEVFEDESGSLSYGRVASGYLTVAAVLAFVAGLCLPEYRAYCATGYNSFLTTAVTLYAASKAQQAIGKFAKKDDDKQES